MKTKQNNLVDLETFIEQQHGKRGTKSREDFEEGYEAFKLGVMIQELRKQKNMTQEQLAAKCGTTKNYISRIENDASDIRLSTLMRIISEGLGGHLIMSIDAPTEKCIIGKIKRATKKGAGHFTTQSSSRKKQQGSITEIHLKETHK